MAEATYDKPIPEPTMDSQPFWDAVKAHRLILQKCANCGIVRHYPRPLCDTCYSMDVEWIEASGKGKVYSWVVAHHPFHAGFKGDIPYIMVTVELDEGVRMVSQLQGVDKEAIRLGMPVEVTFEDVAPEITLPMFRAAE